MRGYGIGEMSRRTNVNIETIRYYERIGILPDPGRTSGGNRRYDQDQLKRLTFIKRCRKLGFSIDEIKTLLEMVDRKDFTCSEIHQLTVEHLATVKQKLADLARLEEALQTMAAKCSRGDIPVCPIIENLFELPSVLE